MDVDTSNARRLLRHEDYTIGWISPLKIEKTAALQMLDEEHQNLEQLPSDHNIYNLGSIGGHNIVIAGLAMAGSISAATVVAQMMTTFPNIRFGLLVGTGGGVPVKSDSGMVRLGDVVVSRPTGQHSGTIQFDHGKAEIDVFKRVGALASPPRLLLSAALDLETQRERAYQDPVMKNLQKIDTDVPGLRKYKYPGIELDHLYPSDYAHADSTLSCGDCGCESVRRIQRSPDDDHERKSRVMVHMGTIGSSELLMKNGVIRDLLAREHGILCFEMEAAGALIDFPCLVIRGISNYSDSHKNDFWQGYAAATAASYARQLCLHVPIQAVKSYDFWLAENGIIRPNTRQDHHDRHVVLNWLTKIDYAIQQNEFFSKRQEGTGKWLLDSQEFVSWVSYRSRSLYCYGMPGTGKTIISSLIVHHLQEIYYKNPQIGIAYIYCDIARGDEQSPANLLLNILKQLAQQQNFIPKDLKDLYNLHEPNCTRPSIHEVSMMLQSVAFGYSKIFIVLDALDELQAPHRRRFLTEIIKLQAKAGTNVLATSRFSYDILNTFQGIASLEIRATEDDLQKYLVERMIDLPPFVSRNIGLQNEIKDTIIKVADGIFLLAQLHLGSLVSKTSPEAIRNALRELPTGSDAYDAAYQAAMQRIEEQAPDSRSLAKQVLPWTPFAGRRLTTSELQHALAVEPGLDELD